MVAQRDDRISPEEYLRIDRESLDVKYEYVDGHMYAMSGGTRDHARIAYNMSNLLDAHLDNSPCRFFQSDVRVQVAESVYYYPDVTVTCSSEDTPGGGDTIYHPQLIVEVLSPSTEYRDRRKKFVAYQACPSIQEYVLIGTRYQIVEVFRRNTDGKMQLYEQFGPGQQVELASIGFTFPIAALYRRTDVPEQEK
ncbi:MAG TPA: Uma2 family endonuclease [Ktedonobacteraceae bacterium]|jgi:Uma2 family endonuclease